MGRNEMESKNVKCSTVIQIIFSPFSISLGSHFRKMTLSRMKWASKPLALCAIAMTRYTTVSVCTGEIAGRPRGRHRTRVFAGHNASNPRLYRPAFRRVNRSTEGIRGWGREVLPNRNNACLVSFQNHKTRTVRCRFWEICSLVVSCNTGYRSPYSDDRYRSRF
jgi:hypothetical protein